MSFFALLTLCLLPSLVLSQAPVGPEPVPPNSPLFVNRTKFDCRQFFRELDGRCTTDSSPLAKTLGSTGRPQLSYFFQTDNEKPRFVSRISPREISNIVFKQTGHTEDECGVSELAVFFGQFIDHTTVASPATKEEMPIPPSEGEDPAGEAFLASLGEKEFPFVRSQRVKVDVLDNAERPANSLSSAIDLTAVYGPDKDRNSRLRKGGFIFEARGELKEDETASCGALLPRNVGARGMFANAPSSRDESLFLAGDHRSNEHPVLASIHTLFLREHNRLARELKVNSSFAMLGDEQIYDFAKRVNEIQFQKIVFEEWFPRITGGELGKYNGYVPDVDPSITLSFSTAAFRFGHTMVGPRVNFVEEGKSMPNPSKSLDLEDAFFNAVGPLGTNCIEGFLRGAMLTRAQRVDTQVIDALREHLFTGISGEETLFDLVALNIQRGRDHAIPNYNRLRARFFPGRAKATCFEQITSDPIVQEKLKKAFSSPGRVEAFAGLLAEDHIPGASFGPTLFRLLRTEFRRLQRGDRLYFRNLDNIHVLLKTYPRVWRVLNDKNFDVLRQLLLDNTSIKDSDLPPVLFKLPVNLNKCQPNRGMAIPDGFLEFCPESS